MLGLFVLMQTTAQAVQTGTPRPPTVTVTHTPFIPSPTPQPTLTPSITPIPSSTPQDSDQVLTVNNLTDTYNGGCDAQDCSLREAIAAAEWGATINFAPGLSGTITLKDSPPIRKNLTINGPGPTSSALVITSTEAVDLFLVQYKVILNLNMLTIANDRGGAIFNQAGIVNLTNVTFRDNQGSTAGAIRNSGTMTITNCTFYGNKEEIVGAIDNDGTLTIINSTFYGNTGRTGGVRNNGTATIISSTFQTNNIGGVSITGYRPITLRNTIIVGQSGQKTCAGAIVDDGNNLQFPGADCGKSIPLGDPKLGPLQDNGGPTWTMALQPGSAAIGKVPKAQCSPTDQRGMGRLNATCDIGAVQQDGVPLTATPTGNR
jgi:CSLREA domain-containing protein